MADYPEPKLSAIVCVSDGGRRLESCLHALRWVSEILIVTPFSDPELDTIAKNHGASLLIQPFLDPCKLWEAGVPHAKGPWYLLLHSGTIVTGQLRKTLVARSHKPCDTSQSFILPRTTVFLKKRFKYPLEWTGSELQCLVYLPNAGKALKLETLPRGDFSFEGEAVHYQDDTLREAMDRAHYRAEIYAERIFTHQPNLSKAGVALRMSAGFAGITLRQYFFKKAFKEGFEGAVFVFFDLLAFILGFLRCHEKYVRTGRSLRDNLGSIRNILIIKLRDIGDNILCTPLVREIKQHLPQASVSILTYNYSLPVFVNNPNIDELHGIPKNPAPSEIGTLIKKLRKREFDVVFNTHAGKLATRLASRIKARHCVTNHYIGINKSCDPFIEESDYYRSSIDRDLDCLRSLGLEPGNTRTELFLTDEEINWARDELRNNNFDPSKKLVIVHPTAAVEIREWEIGRFGKLLQEINRQKELEILVICTDQEVSRIRPLYEDVPDLTVFHNMTLRQMMAIISQSSLVIDNDSSPSHIATVFGIPTIVLFSQAIREIFRPYSEEEHRHFVFYKDVHCRECRLTFCDDRICLDFTPEEVVAKSLEMLSATK